MNKYKVSGIFFVFFSDLSCLILVGNVLSKAMDDAPRATSSSASFPFVMWTLLNFIFVCLALFFIFKSFKNASLSSEINLFKSLSFILLFPAILITTFSVIACFLL